MVGNTDEIVRTGQEYSKLLQEIMQINSIWIFGSRIAGTEKFDSDLDIAVVSNEFETDFLTAFRKANRVLYNLVTPFDIEIHGFYPREFEQDPGMAQNIQKHGLQVS